jgi:large subunit ribosomal protein L24
MEKTKAKLIKPHVRKGDFVIILAGDDKGKKGKVLKVQPQTGTLVVEGINVVKKTTRPTQKMPQGGSLEIELPVSLAKVMLFCPNCKKPARTSSEETANGRVRICKKCQEVIDK